MSFKPLLLSALFLVFLTGSARPLPAFAVVQDGKRVSKDEERRKFHPVPVKGMSAEERMRAHARREQLKKDSFFGGLKWRNVGPEWQSGRVVEITAPLGDPQQVLVAYATGGLYRTDNDGLTWTSLFENQSAFGIGAIAVSRDGKTIWVGSGEANSQRTSYAGTGVFKSTDAGKTWQNMGLPESHHIGKVVIDPKDENTVYVAVLGHLYSQNSERGVYKTTDGGRTWKHVLKTDDYTGAIDIIVDPSNPKIVYASMWDRDRRAWNFRESGAGSAVYQSADGGNSWRKITQLPTGNAAGRTGLALCASKPSTVYAFVDNQAVDPEWAYRDERAPTGRLTVRRFLLLDDEKLAQVDEKVMAEFLKSVGARDEKGEDLKAKDVLEQVKAKKMTVASLRSLLEKRYPNMFEPDEVGAELYRSDDSGKTWKRTDTGQLGQLGGYYWGKVFVNPKDPMDVYVMGVPLLRSQDGGKTWESVAEEAHVDHHAVWHDPRDPRKIWIGNDGGAYLSFDGGKTVRPLNNLSLAQATTLAVDNKKPYNIIIGNQDNGTMRGPSTHEPGKSDPKNWTMLFGGDGSAIAVDPRNDGDLVYIAYQFGQHFALEPGKPARYITPQPKKGEPDLRFNWISPIQISAHQPDILYLGSNKLHRSFDQGRKWEAISPDLTKNRPQGDVPHSTIKDISESPLRFGLIYVGCDDGNVKMTPDGGYQWIDIATPQKDKWVSRIVASRHEVNTVYCSQNGYREDDFASYLWKSTDQGKTWTSITGNLPAEPINVIREDPKDKNVLYVGTDMGTYISLDGGVSWQTLHGSMPNLPVHDLAVQEREDDLVAATHARGAYVVSLKPLRKLTPEVRAKGFAILEAEDLKRGRNWGFDYRAPWDARPIESPKLVGSFFTSNLGTATIRLRDKDGRVVREKSVESLRGINSFELELETEKGRPTKPGTAITPPSTVQDILRDPREANRPKYVLSLIHI